MRWIVCRWSQVMQKNWTYPTPNTLPPGGLGHIVDATEGSMFLQHIHIELNPHLSTYWHLFTMCRHTHTHILCAHRNHCAHTCRLYCMPSSDFKFKGWSFWLCDLIFSLHISVSNTGQPNFSNWSDWILWSVFTLTTKHIQYFSFIPVLYCNGSKWAIHIKAIWAFNHSKHL